MGGQRRRSAEALLCWPRNFRGTPFHVHWIFVCDQWTNSKVHCSTIGIDSILVNTASDIHCAGISVHVGTRKPVDVHARFHVVHSLHISGSIAVKLLLVSCLGDQIIMDYDDFVVVDVGNVRDLRVQ